MSVQAQPVQFLGCEQMCLGPVMQPRCLPSIGECSTHLVHLKGQGLRRAAAI